MRAVQPWRGASVLPAANTGHARLTATGGAPGPGLDHAVARGFLTPDQLDCVNAELEAAFPDGMPADFTLNEEAVNIFSEIGDTCTNVPSDFLCDDLDACNGFETCDDTLDCQPGTPPIRGPTYASHRRWNTMPKPWNSPHNT